MAGRVKGVPVGASSAYFAHPGSHLVVTMGFWLAGPGAFEVENQMDPEVPPDQETSRWVGVGRAKVVNLSVDAFELLLGSGS